MADNTVTLDFKVMSQQAVSGINKLDKSVQDVGKSVTTTKLAFANIVSSGAIALFKSATTVIKNGMAEIITKSIQLEQISTRFKVLTGSAENAAKMMKDLQEFAASTPFQLPGLADTAAQLIAFGFEQDQIVDKLQVLGDIAAAAGKPIGEIGLIFGQVAAAGKLTGERLLQLQERGIPIGPALAETMGVAESAIKDLVSKGQVSFSTFETAMESLNKKGKFAFQGMVAQSKTLGGVLSTLGDNFSLLQTEIGAVFLPAFKTAATALIGFIQDNRKAIVSWIKDGFDKIVSVGKKVLDAITSISNHIKDNQTFYTALGVGLLAIATALTIVATASWLATTGFTALSTAATIAWTAITGPIGLIVIGIGLVAAAAYTVVKNWEKVKTFFVDLWNDIVIGFIDMAIWVLEAVAPMETGFRTIFAAILTAWAETMGTMIQGIIDMSAKLGKIFGIEMPESLTGFKDSIIDTANEIRNGTGAINKQIESMNKFKETIKNNDKALDNSSKKKVKRKGIENKAIGKLNKDKLKSDVKLSEEEKKFRAADWNERAKITKTGLDALSSLQANSTGAAFKIGQASAIAQTTIQTYQAATAAYSSLAGIPIIGPALGAAAAGAAIVAGLANVAKIKNTKPGAGIKFADGGIVPGSSFTGDNVPAFVNSGEMILNTGQQAQLFNLANNKGSNNNTDLLDAVRGLGDRIDVMGDKVMNMEIVLQTSDYEIGRSVQRAVEDGLEITTE